MQGFWVYLFHQGSSAGSLKQPFLAIATAKMKIKHQGRGPERAQTAESLCRLKSTTWTMCHAYQIRQCNLIIQVGSSSDTLIIKYLNLVVKTDTRMEKNVSKELNQVWFVSQGHFQRTDHRPHFFYMIVLQGMAIICKSQKLYLL